MYNTHTLFSTYNGAIFPPAEIYVEGIFVHCAIGIYFSQNVSYLKKEESIVGIFRNLGITFRSLLETGQTLDHWKGLANVFVTKMLSPDKW